jgi:hypothetical protein
MELVQRQGLGKEGKSIKIFEENGFGFSGLQRIYVFDYFSCSILSPNSAYTHDYHCIVRTCLDSRF